MLINPPASPHAVWRIDATKQSIDAWAAGIDAYAPAWMADAIKIERYAIGLDIVPPAAAADPEIVITSMEPGVFGIGIPTDFILCGSAQPGSLGPLHQHPTSDWAVALLSCKGLEQRCFVLNTNWETYQNGLYDLNSHEFGHCLGIGHVGDAADFHATTFPATDVMSYQHDPAQVHCPSNLNILAMQASFADLLGGPWPPVDEPTWDPGYSYVSIAPASYEQTACLNPTPAPLDVDWFPL